MTWKLCKRVQSRAGISILEVMIALMIFGVGILALASSGYVASQTLRRSRSYLAAAAAAQTVLDSLVGEGWAAIGDQTGTATVQGLPVSWSVQDTDPRVVVVVVTRAVNQTIHPDSFVTYVAQ